jgi:hypothetical protein
VSLPRPSFALTHVGSCAQPLSYFRPIANIRPETVCATPSVSVRPSLCHSLTAAADLVTVLVRASKPFDLEPFSPLAMSPYDYQAFTNRSASLSSGLCSLS